MKAKSSNPEAQVKRIESGSPLVNQLLANGYRAGSSNELMKRSIEAKLAKTSIFTKEEKYLLEMALINYRG